MSSETAADRGLILAAVPLFAGRGEPYRRRLEAAGYRVSVNELGRALDENELLARIPDCVATIAGSEPYSERVLAAAERLRVIARMGVGYDQIDVAAASRRGVAVAMAFGTNHEAVADQALTMLAALARRLLPLHADVSAGRWRREPLVSLWRSTVGIVGLGRIGRALARRCRGFDMRVLAYDIAPDDAFAAANDIEMVSLDELLAAADFVSLHVPLTPQTRHLIGAAELTKMKPSAFLINTARGGVIDEAALYAALDRQTIAGAGLDVFEREPPTGSPLLELDQVVLSPHQAGIDERALEAMLNRCVESILTLLDGADPGADYVINRAEL